MKRTCTNCKTPITRHVLVVDNKDFHRKTCYCWYAGHRVEGNGQKPKPCLICEPSQKSPKQKKPDRVKRSKRSARRGRTVMVTT